MYLASFVAFIYLWNCLSTCKIKSETIFVAMRQTIRKKRQIACLNGKIIIWFRIIYKKKAVSFVCLFNVKQSLLINVNQYTKRKQVKQIKNGRTWVVTESGEWQNWLFPLRNNADHIVYALTLNTNIRTNWQPLINNNTKRKN